MDQVVARNVRAPRAAPRRRQAPQAPRTRRVSRGSYAASAGRKRDASARCPPDRRNTVRGQMKMSVPLAVAVAIACAGHCVLLVLPATRSATATNQTEEG